MRYMHFYRKIVGKILYLVTQIMPEGTNAATELPRFSPLLEKNLGSLCNNLRPTYDITKTRLS